MDDTIWRNTDLEDEIMQRQNGILPSYEGLASEILQQTDPLTIQVIRQLFTSPGNGPEFLFQMLRFAEVKQMILPGVEGATDVAVISLQNLRELAKKIHFGYDTTHKYVVVFCALNLVVKARQEGRIQLLFPLRQYAPPPTTQALDKLIKHSRPKVRQFAMRVKQRCILYGIIPESGSPHKECSTSEQQLLQQLYTIIQEEHVEPGRRQRLFQRISSEIISELLTPSTTSTTVSVETRPVVEALPRPARPLALPERSHTNEPVASQPDVVASNYPPASGKNPFAINSMATMGVIQEAKKLIEENQRLLAEDPFTEDEPPFSQPEQSISQKAAEENKPVAQKVANDQPSAPLFDVNELRVTGKNGQTYSLIDDDDIEGLTELEIRGKLIYKQYAIAMADPKTFEKKTKPEVDPKLAEIAARHGKKIVNGEVISIDEFGNEIPKPPKKKAEPEVSTANGQVANAKPVAEKSPAAKKSPPQPKKAEATIPPASRQVKDATPAVKKSPVEKKSPPVPPEVLENVSASEQAAETVTGEPSAEKSPVQSLEDGFSSILMIDPKHYSPQFLTTYVTYNVIDFINILYNNNVNERTSRKQLAMFLAELLDGDYDKWKIHMKLVQSCSAEAITGALVYVFSSLYDQGGHTIANKAGLFTARCREYHAEGLDMGVILRVKSFQDKTFEQMIAFFKSKRQQQLDQQEKFKAANRQTYQQGQQVADQPGATNRDPTFALETPKESNVILVRQGNKVVKRKYNYGRMVTKKKRRTNDLSDLPAEQ
jgi:hypothetical protein